MPLLYDYSDKSIRLPEAIMRQTFAFHR